MARYFAFTVLLVGVLLMVQCRKAPGVVSGPGWVALSPGQTPPLIDEGPSETLVLALDRQLTWLRKQSKEKVWSFGERAVSRDHMIRSLERFRQIWLEDRASLRSRLLDEFTIYRFQWDGRPDILFTGYYAPILDAAREPDERFRFPLYRFPDDAIFVRPGRFDPVMMRPGTGTRDPRVTARFDARRREVVPYHTREEIDGKGVLAGRNLELVWLEDYFEAFLFHVQGGGFVRLRDGSFLKLNYAGKNGHPYASVGRLLVEAGKIPKEQVSIQAISAWFEAHPEDLMPYCFRNKSYVFYQADKTSHPELTLEMYPSGVHGFPVTPLRSIATDKKYFSGGVLAYIEGNHVTESGRQEPIQSFVLDQDTGGAIKNGHIDYFLGAGGDAAEKAGRLKDAKGRLYLFILK